MTNTSSESEPKTPGTKLQISKSPKYWGPVAATMWPVLIWVAAQVVVGVLLLAYAATQHWTDKQTNAWLDTSVAAQFIFTLIVESLILVAVLQLLRHYKAAVKVIGLLKPRLKDVPIALIGFGAYFVAYIVLVAVAQQVFPSLNLNQKQDIGFQDATSVLQLSMTFISLVILPPITEEILFRGFAFTGFRRKFGFVIATLATSILFAIPHLLESKGGGGLLWIAGIDTFILSFVLCFLREKTGRLVPGMGVHALKNFIAFVSLFILQTH
ncbi:MAG TPA: CPBP family intramembrane glutamic endopeptidase [Candidatus Saccharimonadales bacterium]|nr:CPBP family intramembrane glutamic endopeptidase [Candidatus Saccharimonadales bacterium]